MRPSKVYFTDFRTNHGKNLLVKLHNLIKTAGFESIDMKGAFVAVKLHMGEPGNLAYLRPNWAGIVVKMILELGGKPFLCDTTTLYSGRRANALDYIEAAAENGYTPYTVGCPIVIADGIKGMNEVLLPVPNGVHCKEAHIAAEIAQADIIISLNHVKGHCELGFGGAVKNIGMGAASRLGKMDMHCTSHPIFYKERCTGCAVCKKHCAHKAIEIENRRAVINHELCVGCGQCVAVCPGGSLEPSWDNSTETLCEKTAEYAYAVLNGKPHFHINIMNEISPDCDCWGANDTPVVPNIGMAVSFDPVAADMACGELIGKAPVMPGSALTDKIPYSDGDKFKHIHPHTNWKQTLIHAERIGLGSTQYEIIGSD